jgi:hypothetical protein
MPGRKPSLEQEQFVDMSFPSAGIDNREAFSVQNPRQLPSGEWAKSTRDAVNVRGYEYDTNRVRGGQRAGLSKYIPVEPVSGWVIQELALLVGTGYPPPGGTMQTSQSGRVVTLIAVSQGNVYAAVAGATVWTIATNNTGLTPPLNFSGILYSAPLNQKLWFADGVNWCYYDPSINTVQKWTATAGTLPVDNKGNLPRLICNWRGRIVLSGLLFDPQNWFMSAQLDSTNFDYAPVNITPTQAVAGNLSPAGTVGDVVTALIPYNDDTLIFGGDHTIYQMSGDPMAGGQVDLISDSIGMAWGIPWCKDPYGNIYFVSNKTGIYTMMPGPQSQPQRISQQIEQLLAAYDTGTNTFRLMWNDRFQGVHVFISPTVAPGTTTHFFYELRSGSWWSDQFSNPNLDPLCCVVFDGNHPGDRAALIGSWDGFVRAFDPTAVNDDGNVVNSSVVIGPVTSKNLDDFLLKDLQAVLGKNSGNVTYNVYVGATAEQALSTTPVTGTWGPNRNLNTLVRRSGHAIYVKITATNAWSMEVIRARLVGQGKVRRRGK